MYYSVMTLVESKSNSLVLVQYCSLNIASWYQKNFDNKTTKKNVSFIGIIFLADISYTYALSRRRYVCPTGDVVLHKFWDLILSLNVNYRIWEITTLRRASLFVRCRV